METAGRRRLSPLGKVAAALVVGLAILAAGMLLSSSPGNVHARAAGGDPIFMQYDVIQGDVTAAGFEHQVELSSLKFEVVRPVTADTGQVAGPTRVSAIA